MSRNSMLSLRRQPRGSSNFFLLNRERGSGGKVIVESVKILAYVSISIGNFDFVVLNTVCISIRNFNFMIRFLASSTIPNGNSKLCSFTAKVRNTNLF